MNSITDRRGTEGKQTRNPGLTASLDFITQSAFDVWREHEAYDTNNSVPALEAALPALAQVKGRYQGRPLLQWLANSLTQKGDWSLRWSAASALGAMGAAAATKEVLDALLGALTQEGDEILRRRAADALGKMGPAAATKEVVDALLEALTQKGDESLRGSAADALGKMGAAAATKEVLDALLAALTQKEDRYLRGWAASALGKMGAAAATKEVLDALLEALTQKGDWSLPRRAADALKAWFRAKWRMAGPRTASYPFFDRAVLSSGGYTLAHVTELAKLDPSMAPVAPPTISDTDRLKVVVMHLEGRTAHEISAALECSEQEAHHWLERYRTHGHAGLSD